MQHPPPHLHAKCPYCGTVINLHQTFQPGHCGALDCGKTHALKGDKMRRAVWRAQYEGRVAIAQRDLRTKIAGMAKVDGVAPERVHVAAVPDGAAPLTPLPQERRAAYRAHLERITQASFARALPDTPAPDRDHDAQSGEPHGWNDTGCATCQGYCCTQWGGKNFAFQTIDVIDHFRQNHPAMGAEEIIAHFEAAIPEETVKDGCVFQGARGCVLPREARADVCNTFHCYALRQIAARFDPSLSDAVAFVSFDLEDRPQRSGFYKTKDAPDGDATKPRAAEA